VAAAKSWLARRSPAEDAAGLGEDAAADDDDGDCAAAGEAAAGVMGPACSWRLVAFTVGVVVGVAAPERLVAFKAAST